MRKSRIPGPATAEDILGARLRGLKKKEVDVAELTVEEPEPCCVPTEFSNPRDISTGLDDQYAIAVQNELVYVLGEDGAVGHVKIYRIKPDNDFVLVGDLALSEVMTEMVLVGRWLFLTTPGSANLIPVDVGRPNSPQEAASTTFGGGNDIAAQGRWVYVAGDGGINIVDITVPSAARLAGNAS